MNVAYTSVFVRQLKSLDSDLQSEALEQIELFKNQKNHKRLRVHKLHGSLKDRWSFSVNYRVRIVFRYHTKNEAILLAIGTHEVYNT